MWTPDALAFEARPYAGDLWRVVETQYRAATMRITDTLEEQEILERALEDSKPPLPPECAGLHYLMSTPFRYAPYPHGPRFRRSGQPEGAFYASEVVETAIAETAFHRLLFFAESPGTKLPSRSAELTAFSVACATERHVDLTAPPLDGDQVFWTHPTDYGPCQDVADVARAAAIDAIRYRSVRDPGERRNVAVLSPSAFPEPHPRQFRTWHVFPRPRAVQAWCEMPRVELEFKLEHFLGDPRLAVLAERPPLTGAT